MELFLISETMVNDVFVILSNTHVKIVEEILEQRKIEQPLIIDPYDYASDIDASVFNGVDFKIVDNNHLPLPKSLKNQMNKVRFVKKVVHEMNALKINLFVPHVGDIVTNVLYNELNLNGLYIYEDGILLYYRHQFQKRDLQRNIIKKVLSALKGLKYDSSFTSYVPYERIEDKLHGVYLKFPELYAGESQKLFQLKNKKIQFEPSNKILIIGQESYISRYGLQKYLDGINHLVSHITEPQSIWYKPHRLSDEADLREIAMLIDEDRFISDTTPVEEIIEQIRPKEIYSFSSTALLNFKYCLPEKIKIYASSYFNDRLINLFDRAGIINIQE